jgi:hypothetical protein
MKELDTKGPASSVRSSNGSLPLPRTTSVNELNGETPTGWPATSDLPLDDEG